MASTNDPTPETEPFLEGEWYYVPSVSRTCKYRELPWCGDQKDYLLLRRKMIHRAKEAAIQHAEALISMSGGIPDDKLEDMKRYCYGDTNHEPSIG